GLGPFGSEGHRGGWVTRALHTARPHTQLLLRRAWRRPGGGRRPRVHLFADPARAVGFQVAAARRSASGRATLPAGSGILERSLALAGSGGRPGAAGGMAPLRPFPPRHSALGLAAAS